MDRIPNALLYDWGFLSSQILNCYKVYPGDTSKRAECKQELQVGCCSMSKKAVSEGQPQCPLAPVNMHQDNLLQADTSNFWITAREQLLCQNRVRSLLCPTIMSNFTQRKTQSHCNDLRLCMAFPHPTPQKLPPF